MKEDSLNKRYTFKLIANIIFAIINAILVAIIPKALGPVAYGQFNYLQQFYNQLISLIDANTSTAFFAKLSANNNRKELIVFYLYFSIFLFFLIFSLSFIIELSGGRNYVFSGIESKCIYLALIFCFFNWLNQVYIKISDANAITVPVEIIKTVHKILSLLILLVIINSFGLDLSNYLYFNIISIVFLIFAMQFFLSKREIFPLKKISVFIRFGNILKEFYNFCSPLFLFNFIAISLSLIDIWLLQKISGAVEVGFYGLAFSISAMCFVFTSAMTPVIMREFSQSIERKDIESVKNLFSRYVPRLYAISAYFSVFVAFHAAELLLIFTDERFEGAYMALVIMAFYPLHQTYGQINAALLFSAEKVTIYKNIGLFSAFLGVILSVLFIYLFNMGAEGLAWKMVLIQFVSVNFQLFYNAKYLNDKIAKYLLHQFYCVTLLVLIAYTTSFSFFDSLIFDFIISGVLYTSIVIIIFLRFPHFLFGKKVYEK